MLDDIRRADHASQIAVIDDGYVTDATLGHDFRNIDSTVFVLKCVDITHHESIGGHVECIISMLVDRTDHIALGNDTCKTAIRIDDQNQANIFSAR